ncbi:MAG: UDP-glucose 4-epimerase GalE [Acidobacteriota bacterium]
MSTSPSPTSQAVLVAGGAGYIGSHTCKVLKQSGMTPIVLDNLSTGNNWALQFGPFYQGEISDAALVDRIAKEHHPVGAILFAGSINVGESTGNPRKYFQNNITEAIAFLDNLNDSGIRNVVFSSSCAIYGIQEKMPIHEDSSTNPLNPYAETKLLIERVLRWYDSAYSMKHACLRYFNAAGADPVDKIGEHHDPETHLIPLIVYAALGAAKGGKPLRVFGTDYATPDGTAIRDYIHVLDLADGHVRALRHLIGGGDSLALNLGTGIGLSVREVIQAVERISGLTVPIEYGPRRDGDAPALVSDPRRVRAALGWEPKFSDIDTIVRTAWNWHKNVEPEVTTGGR